jgi:hypothetical protein
LPASRSCSGAVRSSARTRRTKLSSTQGASLSGRRGVAVSTMGPEPIERCQTGRVAAAVVDRHGDVPASGGAAPRPRCAGTELAAVELRPYTPAELVKLRRFMTSVMTSCARSRGSSPAEPPPARAAWPRLSSLAPLVGTTHLPESWLRTCTTNTTCDYAVPVRERRAREPARMRQS